MGPNIRAPLPPTWEVVDRYLSGEATLEEAAAVEGYLSRCSGGAEALKQLAALYADAHGGTIDVASAWTALVERLATEAPPVTAPPRTTRHPRRPVQGRQWWSAILGVAAAVLLVAGGVALSRAHGTSPLAPMTTYTTRNGERAEITLADGSTVSLDVGSQLDVPADYASGDRRVVLRHGEALFTVAHHTQAPFSVVAGRTVVHVLGTSFVVRRYATDTTVTVAVRDGKVSVQSVPVTAHRRADVTPDGRVRVGTADPSMFAFAAGTLVLDWMPVRDAIPALERWYDTRIVVTDSAMLARPMKGTFASGALADLSQLLAVTLHAHVVRDGRVLTIAPQ